MSTRRERPAVVVVDMHASPPNHRPSLYFGILPRRYFAAMCRVTRILRAMGADLATIGYYPETFPVVIKNRKKLQRALVPFEAGVRVLECIAPYPEGGDRPTAESQCYRFDDDLVARLYSRRNQVKRALDYVAIFRNREVSWFTAVIPHEKVALFRLFPDEHDCIVRASVALSLNPPPYW